MNIQLSPHFTLSELCSTSFPSLQDDLISYRILQNLYTLCNKVLEPARKRYGKPIKINSGYRSSVLNDKVGGCSNSAHLDGRAADIHCSSLVQQNLLFDIIKGLKLSLTIIPEYKNGVYWIHVNI